MTQSHDDDLGRGRLRDVAHEAVAHWYQLRTAAHARRHRPEAGTRVFSFPSLLFFLSYRPAAGSERLAGEETPNADTVYVHVSDLDETPAPQGRGTWLLQNLPEILTAQRAFAACLVLPVRAPDDAGEALFLVSADPQGTLCETNPIQYPPEDPPTLSGWQPLVCPDVDPFDGLLSSQAITVLVDYFSPLPGLEEIDLSDFPDLEDREDDEEEGDSDAEDGLLQ